MKIIDFELSEPLFEENTGMLKAMLRNMFDTAYPSGVKAAAGLKDSVFEEPLLFYHLMQAPRFPVQQILAGYLTNQADRSYLAQCPKSSDRHGLAYLPGIGYWEASSDKLLHDEGGREWLGATQIELYKHIPDIITDHDPDADYCPRTLNDENRDALLQALEKMRTCVPDLFNIITRCTKNICLFKSETLNSFAAITQHGTCFINVVEPDSSEVFFIDDLAHQCGHIIFNVLTVKTEDFLNYDKNTYIRDLGGFDVDDRNIYSIFHGLFTYSCILESLDAYLEKGYADDQPLLNVEALARLGFYITKMYVDLETLYGKQIFTPLGETYYSAFIKNYQKLYDKYHTVFKAFPYENQPYIFNFGQFLTDYTK